MKINFEEAKMLMVFIDRVEALYGFERPLIYQYVSNSMLNSNPKLLIEHISKQVMFKPHVYERAISYLKSIITTEELAQATERYAEFESLFEQKKQELKKDVFNV